MFLACPKQMYLTKQYVQAMSAGLKVCEALAQSWKCCISFSVQYIKN